jgi:hypothetical protein
VAERKESKARCHIWIGMAPHEKEIFRADAEANEMTMEQYATMCWRNMRSLGIPLRFIPPFPRESWVHPKDREKKAG